MNDDDWKELETYIGEELTGDLVADLYAVYSKMVELQEFIKFCSYAEDEFLKSGVYDGSGYADATFFAWLSCYGCSDQIPERMEMASKFIKRRRNV